MTTPTGPSRCPQLKERINYGTVDVSYLFWEGFYTVGVFGGIGGYTINPDSRCRPQFAAYAGPERDRLRLAPGLDGDFRVIKNLPSCSA